MRPLLIGQAPGPRSDPAEPLAGRCGARLALLCGMGQPEFLKRFDRVNLVEKFPGKAGKGDALPMPTPPQIVRLMVEIMQRRRTVLLGRFVAEMFDEAETPLFKWTEPFGPVSLLAVAPHPSGISRWFIDPSNLKRARKFWTQLANEAATAL